MQVSTAIIYGGIYSLSNTQSSIQDRLGLLSLMAIGNTNLALASTIRAFRKICICMYVYVYIYIYMQEFQILHIYIYIYMYACIC